MQGKQKVLATSIRIPKNILKKIKLSATNNRRSISNQIIFIIQEFYNNSKQ